jgi:AcrR family transcriptional regulator
MLAHRRTRAVHKPVRRLRAPDRRKQILKVAAQLFARQGFRGTTTRQIAERAHVNEAILFRHFPRKEDLYWTILDGKCRERGGHDWLEAELRRSGDDREIFTRIAEEILRRSAEDSTLGRLLLFSALENHRLSHRFFRTHVADYYEILARHIRQRIQERTFRRVDPMLAARGFLGMLVYHYRIQELFGGGRYQKFDTWRVCETLAEIWLDGMRAGPAASERRLRVPPDLPGRKLRDSGLTGEHELRR